MRIKIDTYRGTVEVEAENDGDVTVHPSVYRQPGEYRQPWEGEPTEKQRRSGVYDQPGQRSKP
jgi:hypothetical protein